MPTTSASAEFLYFRTASGTLSGEQLSTVKTVGTLMQPFMKSVPLCCGSLSVNVKKGLLGAAAEHAAPSSSSDRLLKVSSD